MTNEKLKAIEGVLVETDPVKLIKMGAPTDEYSLEALLIYERTNRYFSIEKIHQIVYDIFIMQFGTESKAEKSNKLTKKIIGDFDSYKDVAKKIKEVIEN